MPYRVTVPVRRRAFYALLVAGALAGVIALGLVIGTQLSKNTTSIHAATNVQARQLHSGACLVAVIDDLHGLIAAPLTAEQHREQAREPASVRRLVKKLGADTAAFVHALPKARPCT